MICVVGLFSGCIGLKDQLNPTFESTYMTPMCQNTFYNPLPTVNIFYMFLY